MRLVYQNENMITFDLAEKLSANGFPQKPSISTGGNDGEIFGGFYIVGKKDADAAYRYLETKEYEEYLNRGGDFFIVKIPTLDELIAECGKSFGYLAQWEKGNDAGDWQAISRDGQVIKWDFTPEEAVGNLFLSTRP